MLKFIPLLLLLLTPSVFASKACPKVQGVVRNVIFLGDYDCDLAEDLGAVFNKMAKEFQTAPTVTLIIGGVTDNASFDGDHIIEVPYRLVFYNRYGQAYPVNRANLIVTAAHEYGHAIFNVHLKRAFGKDFKDMFSKLTEISNLKEDTYLDKKTTELATSTTEFATRDDFRLFNSRTIAHSEFFADTLAAFSFRDKSALFRALFYEGITDSSYQNIKMRDFASTPHPSKYAFLGTEHTRFAIARSYVGKNMWPKKKADLHKLSHKILRATLRDISNNLKRKKALDPVAANTALIRELKKEVQ